MRPLSSLLDPSTAAATTPLIMAPTGLDGLDEGRRLRERLDQDLGRRSTSGRGGIFFVSSFLRFEYCYSNEEPHENIMPLGPTGGVEGSVSLGTMRDSDRFIVICPVEMLSTIVTVDRLCDFQVCVLSELCRGNCLPWTQSPTKQNNKQGSGKKTRNRTRIHTR
jgi:hypothetical protein